MRIGVNALFLIPGGVGGAEIYLRSLLSAMAEIDSRNEYFLFTNRETGGGLGPKSPNFVTVEQPVRAASRPRRILWEQAALPIVAARLRLDVMLNPGFTAPLACPCPQVTVFHDLQHKRHPEHFRWFDLPFWRILLFWSAQLSRFLVAVSDATAVDLRRFYRLPELKIRVILSGVDPVFFEVGQRRRPEAFLLAVSTLHPHKNLDRLLRAFALFRGKHPEFRLVVCGMHGFSTAALHELRDSLGLTGSVEFPGWIPREDVYDLYARASAFVYPSTFEGFGLPVLEAMAAALPAACSNIEPLSTIAGDAVLQFDPGDTGAIAASMARLVEDEALRGRLSAAGPPRAALFSWRATAESMLEILQQCETGEAPPAT
jgi:glycosyltransferase involved in cell wall biosynthesis